MPLQLDRSHKCIASETLRALEQILDGKELELVVFYASGLVAPWGVAIFEGGEVDSAHLDSVDCEYGETMIEALDKAATRWSKRKH